MLAKSLFTASLLLFACGSSAGSGTAPDAGNVQGTGRYFPVTIGASWTYNVNDNGTMGVKTQRVLGLEDVGGAKAGVMAFKMETTKPSGKTTLSWQEDTGTALLRHKEQTFAVDQTQESEEYYVPAKLRLDESPEHLVLASAYVDNYDEQVQDLIQGVGVATISKSDMWTVEGIDVSVTVPAGTFDCLELSKFNAVSGSDKRYWFARGVGKVREAGLTSSEELTAFDIPAL